MSENSGFHKTCKQAITLPPLIDCETYSTQSAEAIFWETFWRIRMLRSARLRSKRLCSQASPRPDIVSKRHSMDVSAYKDAATRAAQEAGAIIKAAWNTPRNVMYKGDVDLVCNRVLPRLRALRVVGDPQAHEGAQANRGAHVHWVCLHQQGGAAHYEG